MQYACAVSYCHLWPVWLYSIFSHYLTNGTTCEKNLLQMKCVFWFSLQIWSDIFVVLRRIRRDVIINARKSSCKVPILYFQIFLCVLLLSYVYLLYYVYCCFYFRCRTAGYKSVFGRSCDRPSRHRFFLVSLCLKANAEMLPKIPSCHYMLLM